MKIVCSQTYAYVCGREEKVSLSFSYKIHIRYALKIRPFTYFYYIFLVKMLHDILHLLIKSIIIVYSNIPRYSFQGVEGRSGMCNLRRK